jgi:mitogen-activated protein kinase kinase
MAMKEIRLELDEKKFAQIIMELDILHRCVSPCIIDFYGAFFQEGAVYICVEYMDGGSVDRLYEQGIPENILRKITLSTIMGLKTLKDDHNIIHRDVKPTNILANTRGQVKICDFGVSGNLVASIAKTNIGCQSYMAPERIAGGGMQQSGATSGGTYSVQSDIWSLGLSIIECAMGRYPYPPETYNNIFGQLHVGDFSNHITISFADPLFRLSYMVNHQPCQIPSPMMLMHLSVPVWTRIQTNVLAMQCSFVTRGLLH